MTRQKLQLMHIGERLAPLSAIQDCKGRRKIRQGPQLSESPKRRAEAFEVLRLWPYVSVPRSALPGPVNGGEERCGHLDLDEAVWTLPPEYTKNNCEHRVPLSSAAIELLTTLARLNESLVFPARGSTTNSFSGFSKAKRRLADQCGIGPWTLHDLRRTVATGLAKLEVVPHVIERTLNHVSGSFAGVAGTYNRYAYLNETREALELWAVYVQNLDVNRKG